MARFSFFSLLFAACLLAACGGGSGGASAGAPATLDGAVTEVDGVTSGLGGIEFLLVETGQKVVTRADGTFEIPAAPAGSFTLALTAPGGSAAVDGAAAYAANCSICHGADGSGPPNARGKTAAAYAAALSRGSMASITLTTAEYDAIFTFLGGVAPTPPPPPPPPPPPTGVDGATVYATNCSACHGTDGSGPPNARGKTEAQFAAALSRGGMASIVLTTAEYDAVFAFLADASTPPPPPPTGESDGATLYRASCASCHGDFDVAANAAGGNRQVLGARACTIEGSINGTSVFPGGVPEMAGLASLTAAQIDAIAEYLNSQPVTGQQRYVTNCAGCHGIDGHGGRTGEGVLGESAGETREAIYEESAMGYLACLPQSDTDAIGAWLQGSGGSDDDDGEEEHGDDDEDDGDDDHGHGAGHDADEIEDGDESSEEDISIHRVHSGERIRVRVRIRDGRIERCDVSRVDHDEREVEVFLQPTAANDDPDLTGRLELEERSDRTRIQVSVEHATPAREFEVVVVAPGGAEASLGIRAANAAGEAEWDLDSRVGSLMPFGVGSLAELEGYLVEVRDASVGTVLLRVAAPELPPSASGGAGSGSGSDDVGASAERLRGRAELVADAAGLAGHVEVRSRPAEGRERLTVEAERLVTGRVVEFFVEDAGAPGAYLSVGTRAADAEGEAELELDTGDGDSLPGGVSGASDLVGLGVQVRDAVTGALLLHGSVPALLRD